VKRIFFFCLFLSQIQLSPGQNNFHSEIQLLTPFYFQTWFLVVAGIVFLVAGPLYYRYRTSILSRRNAQLEERVGERTSTIEKQAEELRQLDQLKSRFFDNVSHELRTPLSLIIGPIDNLLKQDYLNEHDRRLLEFVQHNGRQLLNLVNEILDLSKLEAGKLEVKEAVVNWYEALQPTLAQFGSMSDSSSVNLTFDFRADVNLKIYLDLNKFEKIVHNFLSNALKFTPAGGKVELIADDLGDQLLVTVRDNGPGIHPNDLPHIFDRFYQSGREEALVEVSTGIGMSLVKELAELLQGKVWVESVLGQGSSFHFRFPKKTIASGNLHIEEKNLQTDETFTNSTESGILAIKSGCRERDPSLPNLLVVEDNPELREYYQIILTGYNVVTAENGQVARDILQAALVNDLLPDSFICRPDLIISDLLMPVMDGFELLEWVKSRDEYRHVPFIMLTARADMKVKLHALRVGVDDYLTKPFVEDELKIRISKLLDNYRIRLNETENLNPEESEGQQKEKPIMGVADTAWLEKVEAVFSKNLSDTQFRIDWVADEIHLSERQFNRRLKQLTGLSPSQYLREMRLQTAKDFLHAGNYNTIKELSIAVGYMDTAYFSRLFQERFGVLPSEYLK